MACASLTHVVTLTFLLSQGTLLTFLLGTYARCAQPEPLAIAFFRMFWLPALFVVPAITAPIFAGRLEDGTFATLRVLPLRLSSLLLGDWLVVYGYYLKLWLLSLFFPWVTLKMFPAVAQQMPFFPLSSVLGGGAFIALSGAFFIAVGLFVSSLVRHTSVAVVLGFLLLLAHFLAGEGLRHLENVTGLFLKIPLLSPDFCNVILQMEDFCRGRIDTRVVVLYAAGTLFFLFLTHLRLGRRSL